jgi:riboflavin kinase / FMN adenylyltransferase
LKVYQSLDEFKKVKHAVVTLGTFDGVHQGHRKILQRVRELANDCHGEVVLLTFFPHPRMVLYPGEHGVELLNTPDEKIDLLENAGVDHLIIHPFSATFSQVDPEQFIADILVKKLGTYKLVIGYDHRFGHNRQGSFDDLVKMASDFGFEVEKIPEKDVDDVAVSSTRIRELLNRGEIEDASRLLGGDYRITGMVTKGEQLGRKLGFPTANLIIPPYKLIPTDGVYICNVLIDGECYYGLLSIGRRPTVLDNGELSVEVFIINFDKNIYGKTISISIVHKIRSDKKFNSLEELTTQMHGDLKYALHYIETKPQNNNACL